MPFFVLIVSICAIYTICATPLTIKFIILKKSEGKPLVKCTGLNLQQTQEEEEDLGQKTLSESNETDYNVFTNKAHNMSNET